MKKDKSNNLYYLSLPNDWTDQTCYTFTGPDINNFRHNLIVTCERKFDKKSDLEAIAHTRIEHLLRNFEHIEILKSEEKKMSSSGKVAFEVVYKFTQHEGGTIFQKLTFIMEEGKLYTFTASFTKETLGTIGAQVDEIIDSFRQITDSDIITSRKEHHP